MRIGGKIVAATALTAASAVSASCNSEVAPTFPAKPDPAEVVMRLERFWCMGTCPVYSVEIRGDGRVSYVGERFVLIEGPVNWTIPQADAAALIEEFRKADYFELMNEYSDGSYDANSERSQLTIASRTNYVIGNGKTCESAENAGACVPQPVRALHDAIDRLSAATAVTGSNVRTIPLLEEAGFDFRSAVAANSLVFALNERNTGLARELISRGAPLNGGILEQPLVGEKASVAAIVLVPFTADVDLAKSMIANGAIADEDTRQLFLLSSAASGSAPMTKLALEHNRDLRKGQAVVPWVVAAASARMETEGTYWQELYARPEYALWKGNFDPPAVLRLLIAAGADPGAADPDGNTALHLVQSGASAQVLLDAGANPHAVNDEGRTPLHEADREDLARVLIRAGARVNAEDSTGKTPLFDRYDAGTVRALLQAGADVHHRARGGITALFFQSDPDTTAALIEAGAEVEHRTKNGLSALQTAKSTRSALVILRAGASLAKDPAARNKLMAWAASNDDEALLRELRSRAAAD